jgi:hypothetical protein
VSGRGPLERGKAVAQAGLAQWGGAEQRPSVELGKVKD